MTTETLIVGGGLAGLSAAYHSNGDYLVLERDVARRWPLPHQLVRRVRLRPLDPHPVHEAARSRRADLRRAARRSLPRPHAQLVGLQPRRVHRVPVPGEPPRPAGRRGDGLPARPRRGEPRSRRPSRRRTSPSGRAPRSATASRNHFFLPYNEKVWAIPPDQMDFRWIADRVPVPDLEEVIRGLAAGARPCGTVPTPPSGTRRKAASSRCRRRCSTRLEPGAGARSTPRSRRSIRSGARSPPTTGETHGYENLITSLPLPTLVQADARRAAGGPPGRGRSWSRTRSSPCCSASGARTSRTTTGCTSTRTSSCSTGSATR